MEPPMKQKGRPPSSVERPVPAPGKKFCSACGAEKATDEFYRDASRKDGRCFVCIPCTLEAGARSMQRKKVAGGPSWATTKGRRLRQEVLSHYGGDPPRCECCGEGRFEFLSIDHIGGGGNAHRKAEGSGQMVYRDLKRRGYPPGFRVLCHNCNQAFGYNGYCPHQLERGEPIPEKARYISVPPPPRRDDRNRESILACARRLVTEGEEPKVRVIAAETGVHPNIIYGYRTRLRARSEWPELNPEP